MTPNAADASPATPLHQTCGQCAYDLSPFTKAGFCPRCGTPHRASAQVDPAGFLVESIPCRECGYDLRGLQPASHCPECNLPVAKSVHGDLLRYGTIDWLAKLSRGATLLAWSVLLPFAAMALVFLSTFFTALLGTQQIETVAVVLMTTGVVLSALLSLSAAIMYLLGAWWVTTPDPSGLGEAQYGRVRRFTRIALAVVIISYPLSLAAYGLATVNAMGLLLPPLLGSVSGLMWLGAFIGLLIYISRLAERVPDRGLATSARWIWRSWLILAVVMVLFVVVFLFGTAAAATTVTNVGPPATAPANAPAPGAAPAAPGQGMPVAPAAVGGGLFLGTMVSMCLMPLVGIAALALFVWYVALLWRLRKVLATQHRFATDRAALPA